MAHDYPTSDTGFLEAIESMLGGELSKDTGYAQRVNPRGRHRVTEKLRGFLSQLRDTPDMLDDLLAEQTEVRDAPAYEPTHTLGGRGLAESSKAGSSQLRKEKAGDLVSQLESLSGALGGSGAEAAAPEAAAPKAAAPEAAVSEEEYEAAAEVPASDYADLERAQRTGTRLGEGKEARAKKEAGQMKRAMQTGERLGEGDEGRAAAAAAPDPKLMEDLFRKAHGGPFDPKSSMDKRKMAEIDQMLGEMGGEMGDMTENQFALKLYRQFDYV